MKKILLTLGTLSAIAAPIAAVVSCGGVEHKNPPIKANGGSVDPSHTDNVVNAMAGVANSKGGSFTNPHKYSAFQMNGEEIVSALLNTKVHGQLNISDSNISKWKFLGSGLDQNKSEEYFKSTLINQNEKPSKVINIKKTELVDDSSILEIKNDEIYKSLDENKKYIYKVEEVTKDSDENEGEWNISFFEAKTPTKKILDAVKMLKSDFDFDKDGAIAEMGGMYLYAQSHIFGEEINEHKITSNFGGVKSGGLFSFISPDTYKDRANKDNFVDWVGYKPKKDADLGTIKAKLKDINIDASFVLDMKTLKPKLRLNILDKEVKQLETIYIDSKDAFDFNTTNDAKDFNEIWTKNFKFSTIFSKINKLKSSASQLLEEHVPGVGLRMFDFVDLVNVLARTNDFNQTSEFTDEFYSWLKTQKDINVNSLINGMKNFHYEELDDPISIGSKGWVGFNDAFILGQKLKIFLENEISKHDNWTEEKITTVAQFNQKLIDDSMKGEES